MKRTLFYVASGCVVIGAIGAGIGAVTGNLWKTPVSLGVIDGTINPNDGVKNVEIVIPSGNVRLTGTSGTTVKYSGALTALHQRTQADANRLIRSEWKVERSGDTLKLFLQQRPSQREGLNASWRSPHLELQIPRTMTTEIRTSNGSVNISAMDAECVVQTSNDTVTASDVNGSVNMTTSSGKITLKNITGSVTVRDSNGGIDASTIRGAANLQTSNGAIILKTVTGSVEALNSNGAITGSSVINGKWFLKTSNAHISLSVPRNTNASIYASTSNGSIKGGVHWISQSSDTASCNLGSGVNKVQLETSNGSISVN